MNMRLPQRIPWPTGQHSNLANSFQCISLLLLSVTVLQPTGSNADWAGTTVPSADTPVLISSDVQLFFALTNSSITNVQLTEDIVLHASNILWTLTGGPIMRTSNVTMRGSPQPGNPYFPLLDLIYKSSAIRMARGTTLSMFNFALRRWSFGYCGPDFVGPSPGSYMYSENVWNRLPFMRPYELTIQNAPFTTRVDWAPPNQFRNLTDGLCVSAPDYKCWRAHLAINYYCNSWDAQPSPIPHWRTNVTTTAQWLLDDYCAMDGTPASQACITNFTGPSLAQLYRGVPMPVTLLATTASQLVSAMINSTVDLVLVTQDITDWTDAQAMLSGMQLPVVRNRNITIQGAALPGVYPTLDFKFMRSFLRMANGSSLQFEQLVVSGLQVAPEPKAMGLTAVEWADSGALVLKDSLWLYSTCPDVNDITNQLAATTSRTVNAGAQAYTTLLSPACIQRPTTPVPSTAPASGPNLAAFPPSSYTACFAPAWALQDMVLNRQPQPSNGVAVFRNSWIVCGESSAISSPTPVPDSSTNDTNWRLIVGLTVGLGGAAIMALAAAVLIWSAKKQRQLQHDWPSESGDGTPTGSSSVNTKGAGKMPSFRGSGPSSLLSSSTEDLNDYGNAQSVLLDLAKQTCAQTPTEAYDTKINPTTPLVEGLSITVDVAKSIVVQDVIGVGTHGVVHRGLYNGRPVALKVLALDLNLDMLAQELNILGRVRNANVVGLVGAGCSETNAYMILELCDNSLDKLIYGCAPINPPLALDSVPAPTAPPAGRQLSLDLIMSVGMQVAQGLACLHPTIIHRDLKPSNILLKTTPNHTSITMLDGSQAPAPGGVDAAKDNMEMDGSLLTVKLSDFGLSRMMASVVLRTGKPAVGTIPYMAPECFKQDSTGITCNSDIYSLGVVLWEMIHGQQPWAGLDAGAILYRVLIKHQGLGFTAPEDRCPPRLRALIERCWDMDPDCRPSANDVVVELGLIAGELKAASTSL